MKKVYTFFSLIIFISFIIAVQSCSEETTAPENQAPQIQSLTSNPNTSGNNRLAAGGTITYTVTATDPDQDPLTYTWECTGGSFTQGQNTSTVIWQSPITQNTASYTITIKVSDGALITSSSQFAYVAAATPGINAFPTSLDFGSTVDTLQIKIFNTGTGSLNWQIQDLTTWLSASPVSGTISQPTDTAYPKIIVDRGSLSPGNYSRNISAVNTNNTSNKVTVSVNMVVATVGYVEGHTYYAGTTIPVSGVTINIDNAYYTTGPDGYYRLNNITLGNKLLKATKDGYDTYQININVLQGRNTKDILMTSALYTHNVYGVITSASTLQPLQGVEVTVLNDDGTPSELKTISDFNGNYQVPTVPQGQRKIRFKKLNYQIITPEIFMSNSDYLYDVQLLNKPGIPFNPYPLNNTTNQIYFVPLSWDCIDPDGNILKYDVILDLANPPQQIIATNVTTNLLFKVLDLNTTYYWKIRAKDNYGNSTEGPIWQFTTGSELIMGIPCPGLPTVEYEGKSYNTILLAFQCWLKENLDIGTRIDGVQDPINNGVIEKYCYDNLELNCITYGGLYHYNEAMLYSNNEGGQGICPSGWHIPTFSEVLTLQTSVNNDGNSLLEIGQGSGTNSSGFSALLSGKRRAIYNDYSDLGSTSYMWSSTPLYSTARSLQISSGVIYISVDDRNNGYSIRCVKD